MFRLAPLFTVMQYLHDAVHRAKGVCFLIKVFREAGCVAIVSECFFVLFVPCGEASSSLSDIRLLQLGQVSLYTPDNENLSGVRFLWEISFP